MLAAPSLRNRCNAGRSSRRFHELDARSFSELSHLLLLALALLLFSFFRRAAERRLLGCLHVAEASLVVMCVRVGVLVVLRDVLKLLFAEIAVERFDGAGNFGLDCCAFGHGTLEYQKVNYCE